MSALITSRWLNDDGTVNWNRSSHYQMSLLFSPVLPEFLMEEKVVQKELNYLELRRKEADCIRKKLDFIPLLDYEIKPELMGKG